MKSEFIQRHIGPSRDEQAEMLKDLGLTSVDELVRQVGPDSILLRGDGKLPEGCDEQEALTELKEIAELNVVKRTLIGQGYYGTITPPVIQRNVFENPAWYTSYLCLIWCIRCIPCRIFKYISKYYWWCNCSVISLSYQSSFNYI